MKAFYQKKQKWVAVLVASISLIILGYADGAVVDPLPAIPSGWFIGPAVGITVPLIGHKTNYATSGIPGFPFDKYVADRKTASAVVSVLAGYQWRRDAIYFPAYSLGLEYA